MFREEARVRGVFLLSCCISARKLNIFCAQLDYSLKLLGVNGLMGARPGRATLRTNEASPTSSSAALGHPIRGLLGAEVADVTAKSYI